MRSSHIGRLPRQYNPQATFLMQLTSSESSALSQLLPPGFSLSVELKEKIQQLTKKKVTDPHVAPSVHLEQSKPPSKQTQKNNKKATKVEINEAVKPLLKIIEQLKGYKHSWPFLTPVDPEASGVPEYFEIVKNPMDLQTVEKKFKAGQYLTPRELYDDINLIVKNSYLFNEYNEDFVKITQDFERYFHRIAGAESKPVVEKKTPPPPPVVQKPKTVSVNQTTTATVKPPKKKKRPISKDIAQGLALPKEQKLELAEQLSRLSKEHLHALKKIVFSQESSSLQNQDEFDLEKIGLKKIRDLQRFIKARQMEIENRKQFQQQTEKKQTVTSDEIHSEDEVGSLKGFIL